MKAKKPYYIIYVCNMISVISFAFVFGYRNVSGAVHKPILLQ